MNTELEGKKITNCLVFKVINFGRLRRYGAKEDLVLIHPKGWLEGVSYEDPELHIVALLTKLFLPSRLVRQRL